TATQIALDPLYDPSTNVHDVALITVDPPLFTGSQSQNGTDAIAPISFASMMPSVGAGLTVSGWGDMSEEPADGSGTATFSNTLQKATVPLVDDTDCVNDYGPSGVPIDPMLLFCAGNQDEGSGITDSCQGDSGGPIVTGSAGSYVLLGLVASGLGCAQAGFPGIYTRLANSDLQTFLNSDPPPAPSQSTATTLSRGASPGQSLTCASGSWSGSPNFTYQFFNSAGTALTPASPTATYTVQASDISSRIQCEVEATNDGG